MRQKITALRVVWRRHWQSWKNLYQGAAFGTLIASPWIALTILSSGPSHRETITGQLDRIIHLLEDINRQLSH